MIPINRVTARLLNKRGEVEKMMDEKEKVRWVWRMLMEGGKENILDIEGLWAKPSLNKCLKKAEKLKKIGNIEFGLKHLHKSLKAYNEALCQAPVDSSIVALIVANRGQVLYELGHFNLALLDIKLSQDSGYPPHLLYKLAAREGICFSALGMREEARKSFEKAKESLGELTKDNDSRRSYIRTKAGSRKLLYLPCTQLCIINLPTKFLGRNA